MFTLGEAAEWLAGQLREVAPAKGTLLYQRVAGGTIDLSGKAWIGRTAFRVSDETGQSRLIWSDRDYLVPVADLLADGVAIEPARGDRFEETLPGKATRVFEVAPYVDEPEWRYSDPQRTVYRVHTKEQPPAE